MKVYLNGKKEKEEKKHLQLKRRERKTKNIWVCIVIRISFLFFFNLKINQEVINMSMEAQFYEARRRQSNIERRSSLRTEQEINKQLSNQQNKYQYLSIPVRVIRQDEKKDPCTCNLIRRMSLIRTDQPLFQRDRDIYP